MSIVHYKDYGTVDYGAHYENRFNCKTSKNLTNYVRRKKDLDFSNWKAIETALNNLILKMKGSI